MKKEITCPWLLQAIQYKSEWKEARILTNAVMTSNFCKLYNTYDHANTLYRPWKDPHK